LLTHRGTRERDQVYSEFRRVLKPGGNLVFYDVIAADEKPDPYFPLPWSESEDTSFLLTKVETIAALEKADLSVSLSNDMTQAALAWFAQRQPRTNAPGRWRALWVPASE
jgi:MPBQ/MSBQ methyltransferase